MIIKNTTAHNHLEVHFLGGREFEQFDHIKRMCECVSFDATIKKQEVVGLNSNLFLVILVREVVSIYMYVEGWEI